MAKRRKRAAPSLTALLPLNLDVAALARMLAALATAAPCQREDTLVALVKLWIEERATCLSLLNRLEG